ncbi:MAG: hypothetical protein P4L56_17285 [Candidatus Sulfopaludibacter sp.]|nr:hypothetical protein [Candidatus Sulfopaludibacter sp.]
MIRRSFHTAMLLLAMPAAAVLCLAQGRYGPGDGAGSGSTLNMTKAQTVAGTVSAVNIGYGMQYPSIAIGKVQVKVAPVWYLLDSNFEIKTGDALSILAAPANLATDPYLYAVEITNTATNLRIVLRDARGVPLWTSRQTSGTPLAADTCLAGATVMVASGTVEQFNSGVGIQMPTLTVKVSDGSLLTFKLGPERVLLAFDLELKAGESVTVKYAVASCTGESIAMAVTNAAGVTVVLRDELGRPAWR